MQIAQQTKKDSDDITYMRMSDIKKIIPVSSGTLYNWVKRGILTPIKIKLLKSLIFDCLKNVKKITFSAKKYWKNKTN